MIDARRVDFIGLPVQDLARADAFYGGTLGLRRNPNSGERWVECETGNVTIALISPEAMGLTSRSSPTGMAFFSDPDGDAFMFHRRYASRD